MTDNAQNEGVYAMRDGNGGTLQVPYSKVATAQAQGYQLTGGSSWTGAPQGDAGRYVRDSLADPVARKAGGEALADTVEGRIGGAIADTAKQLGGGLRDVFTPTEAESRSRGMGIEHGMALPGSGAPMTPQEQDAANARSIRGLTNVIGAGGKVGVALGGPELLGMAGLAAGGDTVAIAALARVAASMGIGTGASAAAGKVSDTMKLSPEAKALAQTAAFWAGAGLTGYAAKVEPTAADYGAKGVKVSTPRGGMSLEVGGRPGYRQPSPEGSYGEGSTVIPGKAYVRGEVAGRRFGTGPEAPAPSSSVSAAAQPRMQRALPAPEGSPASEGYWAAGPAAKPVQSAPPPTVPDVSPEGMDAGHVTAGHPDMQRALQAATGEHLAVGTETPDGDTVHQPSNHPAINQALATTAMPELRADLRDVVQGIPGARLAATRDAKDPERLAQKINQDGSPAETVKDYGAAQISVDSAAARDAVVAGLKAKYPVVTEKDQFSKGDEAYGYRVHSLQLQTRGGGTVEVQVVPREVLDANPDQHTNYVAAREAQMGGDRRDFDEQAKVAKSKNDAAMAKFEARNAAPAASEPPAKPLHEMTPEELGEGLQEARGRDKADLQAIFGKDGAARYAHLQRSANSTVDLKRADAAAQEIQEMEGGLSPTQRERLFGVGDTRHQVDDLHEYGTALAQVDGSSPEALAHSLRYAVGRIDDPSVDPKAMQPEQRLAYAQLRHGFEIASNHGWDTGTIIREAIRSSATQFADPEDALLMLEKAARSVGPARSDAAGKSAMHANLPHSAVATRPHSETPVEGSPEPPLAAGMTRLYHGGTKGRYDGPAWLSTDRKYAEGYAAKIADGEGELQYADHPTEKVNAIADPDGYGQTPDRGFHVHTELHSDETGIRTPLAASAPQGDSSSSLGLEPSERQVAAEPTPATHVFDAAQYARNNPTGDVEAAKQEALKAGYEIENGAHESSVTAPAVTAPAATSTAAGITKGAAVVLSDGTPGTVRWSMGGKVRVQSLTGERLDATLKNITPVVPPKVTVSAFGSDRERAIAARTEADGPALVSRYLADNTRDGVVSISTDAARALFPEYREDPTGATMDVGSSASAIADAAWKTALAMKPQAGRDVVAIIAGSPASGKTSGQRGGGASERVGIVRESIPTEMSYADRMIGDVLAAGRSADLQLVFTDDPRINVRRMVERGKQIGRTVPLDFLARAYVQVPQVAAQVAEKYAGRVQVGSVDNSGGPGDVKAYPMGVEPALRATGRYTVATAQEAMHEELERLRTQGLVPDAIYRAATASSALRADQRGGTREDDTPVRREPESGDSEQSARRLVPADAPGSSGDTPASLAPAAPSAPAAPRTPLQEKAAAFAAASVRPSVSLQPGEAGEVPVRALHLNPKRFQYKVTNVGPGGVTELLAGKRWNPDLAGVVSVWRDPENGKAYVVNGHHRVDLAKRTGQTTMLARMLDVKTAEEARARGALQNIADGRGTVIDAAKFFRDAGVTAAHLDAEGISMGEATAQNGMALSQLATPIFDQVVQGRMSQGRGIAIGRETSDHATQEAILRLVEKKERGGTKVTDGTVEELARFARTAPLRQETAATLFGDQDRTESTVLDKAAVSSYVLREIGADRRAFGAVATDARATRLAADGRNLIDVAGNAEKAKGAEQAAEVYRRLSARRGPIDDILNRAAEERANAKSGDIAGIDRRAYDDIRAAVSHALTGGEDAGAAGLQASAGRGSDSPAAAAAPDAGRESGGLAAPALPGMAEDVARQRAAAREFADDEQRESVQASLDTPAGSIGKAAGEMERNSPLFRESGASGQGGLFGGDDTEEEGKPSSGGGGTKLYSNPLDPELFRKYIGEPLMQMAEPLREELAHRADIAGVANNVHDTLQRLDRVNKAATLEAKGIARAFEEAGFTKADGDKVFAHLEDSSVRLTPEQEQLRDKWIKPLDQRAAYKRKITLLIKSGKYSLEDILAGKVPQADADKIAPEQGNYQHRIAVEKNTFVDKMIGDSLKRFRAPGAALSKSFSSGKRSVFQEITGPGGEREAVAVKNGRVTQFRGGDKGEPVTTDLGAYRGGFVNTAELAKEAAAPLEKKIADLKREHGILTGTSWPKSQARAEPEAKGRAASSAKRIANIVQEVQSLEKQVQAIHQSIGDAAPTMTDAAALDARLKPIQKVIERLLDQKQKLLPTSDNLPRIERLTQRIQKNERLMEEIRDQHEGPALEGRYWRDKEGGLWKFGRGTTAFITERTGQRYHANAMLSSLVNFMETSKAMNAAVVLERTKGLLENNGMAMQTPDPTKVPDGWKPTSLLQMHGYYLPAHVADALDQFDYLQSRGQPNVLERANRFVISSVLMNPLAHAKNIAANWFTGKAAEAVTGSAFVPKWYAGNMAAGVKAVNTLRDLGGPEYRRLLREGLDLQGANADFDRTTKDILRSFTEALDKDKESSAAMRALLGVSDAAGWLQHMNHLMTFGVNDLFVLQSYYAAEAKFQAEGVPNASEAARDWAHKQVVEYTTPVRVGGSAAAARLLENPNVSAFWRYHFGGIVRPIVSAVKEAAGAYTPNDEATAAAGGAERDKYGQSRGAARTNAVGRLAVMTAFATVVFPKLLDQVAKKMTGDAQAKAPRGGVLGAASNLAESVEGDRSWGSTVGSVLTPALGTEELLEMGINRDFFTGKHIMGTNVGFTDKAKQLGSWLASKSTPGQISHRFGQGAGQRALWGLLGFAFPMEHGLKEAAEIRNENEGSNPTDPHTAKVWATIIAAAEQSRRSGGKDTSVKDALLRSKVLSPNQRRELMMAVHETPIVFAAVELPHDDDVWRVYEHSTSQEKHELTADPRTRRRLTKYATKLRTTGESEKAAAVTQALTAR